MKMRWCTILISSVRAVIFDGSDYEALDSVNYEMMDVSNLTKNENGGTVTPGDDEKSFNPCSHYYQRSCGCYRSGCSCRRDEVA